MADDTYTVKAPVSNFSGTRAGVTFEEGEAEATEAQARELAWRGYRVPALEDEDGASDEDPSSGEEDPLQAIDGIGPARSEDLGILGLDTPEALAEADAEEVAEAIDGVDVEDVEAWQDQV